jgi:hypothetical protein
MEDVGIGRAVILVAPDVALHRNLLSYLRSVSAH